MEHEETRRGSTYALIAQIMVGGSVAASSVLGDYPLLGGQGVRYALASLGLFIWARASKRAIPKPSRTDFLWLGGVAVVGMALFNILLILATNRVDPSLVGAVVGVTPIALAIAGAIQLGVRPKPALVAAAVMVTLGTLLVVQARAEGDLLGILLAIGVMLGEVGFSLLAVPVLKTIGPVAVSVHTTWMAAALLLVAALLFEGSSALRVPTSTEFWALAFLAVMVTAVAFVLWYSAVDLMGAATAGLFTGIIPVSALFTSVMIGTDSLSPAKLAGVLIVGAGVAYGMWSEGNRNL